MFLVGAARSGTSLLYRALCLHPDVAYVSNYVRRALEGAYPGLAEAEVVVLDKLTYAGNRANLDPVAASPRLRFVTGDICDAGLVEAHVRAGAGDRAGTRGRAGTGDSVRRRSARGGNAGRDAAGRARARSAGETGRHSVFRA